jgi:predicted metal-dependent hydrolase
MEEMEKYFRIVWRRVRVRRNKKDYLKYKTVALDFVQRRIEFLNKKYGFVYNRVSIKNQRTRWGSCSKKGNLNFNYKIALLPERLSDYLIVHELCHLKEFNHSENFWNLVSKTVPNYLELRKELRKTTCRM